MFHNAGIVPNVPENEAQAVEATPRAEMLLSLRARPQG